MDVEHQLVLPLLFRSAICLQLPPRSRQRYASEPILSLEVLFANDLVAASQMAQQMGQMNPAAGFGPGVDPDKQFLAEAENLAVIEHYSVLDGVEQRLLEGIAL